jgi:uncharacterized protein YndB with AHSA1/START domain
MKTIIHTVDIQAKPEAVYQAVATEKGLSGWWTTKVKAEERVGGVIDFTFMEGFGPKMKITQLEPSRLVSWTCVGGHEPWIDNTFRFEVVSQEAGTRLRFRQDYSQELGDDQYGIYNFNWAYYLESLRLYCTTGTGKPFLPEKVLSSPARR